MLERFIKKLKLLWDIIRQIPFAWPWDIKKISKRLRNLK